MIYLLFLASSAGAIVFWLSHEVIEKEEYMSPSWMRDNVYREGKTH